MKSPQLFLDKCGTISLLKRRRGFRGKYAELLRRSLQKFLKTLFTGTKWDVLEETFKKVYFIQETNFKSLKTVSKINLKLSYIFVPNGERPYFSENCDHNFNDFRSHYLKKYIFL